MSCCCLDGEKRRYVQVLPFGTRNLNLEFLDYAGSVAVSVLAIWRGCFRRISAPTSGRMEIKPRWEPGPGILVTNATIGQGRWTVQAKATVEAKCPSCGAGSTRRHSAYVRRLQDLPVQATPVELHVGVTRWRCCNKLCPRQTFVDRTDHVFLPHARQTCRVAELARSIGYVAGGRPTERLMRRLGLPQGDDRILRNLKRHAASSNKPLRVVGIDDWSWLKGSKFGTIIVDLERREVVDVLHDRSATSVAAWLERHPTIEIVSRDRCGLYAQAARQGAASARQVADRFHLIQNLRLAIEQQLSYNYRSVGSAHTLGAPPQDERSALREHRQMVRIGRRSVRLEQFRKVKALHQSGLNLSRIVDETGLGWRTVATWVTLDVLPERRLMDPRSTNPARFQDFLARLWNAGCKNGRKLLIEDRGSKAGIHGQLQPSGTSPQQMAPFHQHPCGAGREIRHPPRPRCDGYSERAADRRIHSMHEATRAADATGGGKGGQLEGVTAELRGHASIGDAFSRHSPRPRRNQVGRLAERRAGDRPVWHPTVCAYSATRH